MVDLALRMLLLDKIRTAITILGVGFAVALVMIQIGLFFGLLQNASITIDRLDADLWVTARNTANVDFGNPFRIATFSASAQFRASNGPIT